MHFICVWYTWCEVCSPHRKRLSSTTTFQIALWLQQHTLKVFLPTAENARLNSILSVLNKRIPTLTLTLTTWHNYDIWVLVTQKGIVHKENIYFDTQNPVHTELSTVTCWDCDTTGMVHKENVYFDTQNPLHTELSTVTCWDCDTKGMVHKGLVTYWTL